jgi:hypothetical protein
MRGSFRGVMREITARRSNATRVRLSRGDATRLTVRRNGEALPRSRSCPVWGDPAWPPLAASGRRRERARRRAVVSHSRGTFLRTFQRAPIEEDRPVQPSSVTRRGLWTGQSGQRSRTDASVRHDGQNYSRDGNLVVGGDALGAIAYAAGNPEPGTSDQVMKSQPNDQSKGVASNGIGGEQQRR